MNSTLTNLLIFATGACVGSVVTWKYVKTKYEQIAQEEIDSVKEHLGKRIINAEETIEADGYTGPLLDDISQEDVQKNSEIITKQGYTNYSNIVKKEKEENNVDKPYVIEPGEYGEMDGYETVSLNYFADGVVADDDYNELEDIDGTIGEDSLDHFGEFEDDSVFVRNDALQCDYEILLDTRRFHDVVKKRGHRK